MGCGCNGAEQEDAQRDERHVAQASQRAAIAWLSTVTTRGRTATRGRAIPTVCRATIVGIRSLTMSRTCPGYHRAPETVGDGWCPNYAPTIAKQRPRPPRLPVVAVSELMA